MVISRMDANTLAGLRAMAIVAHRYLPSKVRDLSGEHAVRGILRNLLTVKEARV